MNENELILITSTWPAEDSAREIAGELVEQKLAACVQLSGPLESCYRWEGKVEISREWLLTVKTPASLADAVLEAILAAHPYEVPEVLLLPILGGNPAYLKWVRESTRAVP